MIIEVTPVDLSNILLIRGLRTFPSDDIKAPKEMAAKTEQSTLYNTIRKQRNALAHDKVDVASAMECMKNIQRILQFEDRSQHEQCTRYQGEKLLTVTQAISLFKIIKQLSRKKNTHLAVGVRHSENARKRDIRLKLSIVDEQNFIGRRDNLAHILRLLLPGKTEEVDDGKIAAASARILIHGPPGIGKTTLVRKVAVLTRETLRQQCVFQATTEATLVADISSFLRSAVADIGNVLGSSIFSSFKRVLAESKGTLLLIFEDVRDPSLVWSLLPNDKHCVLFTGFDNVWWTERRLVPAVVTAIRVEALNWDESFQLFKSIIDRKEKRIASSSIWKTTNWKKYLMSQFLTDVLLGLPLAIRLFAFQYCTGEDNEDLSLAFIREQESCFRLSSDEKASGRVHIRGFHHIVRFALNRLRVDGGNALKVCSLLSYLPGSTLPISFLEMVCLNMGLSPSEVLDSLCSLAQVGLVSKLEDGWTMHQIIKNLVVKELLKDREMSLEAVLEALVEAIRQETLGKLDALLADVEDGSWASVVDSSNTMNYNVMMKVRDKQEFQLQLEIIIEHILKNSSAHSYSWELLDKCLRCLQWCRPRTSYDAKHRMNKLKMDIWEAYAVSSITAREMFELHLFKSKDAFLNFLSARWSRIDVGREGAVENLLFDLETHLSTAYPVDLMELLGCLAGALLPAGEDIFGEEQKGLALLKIFALYGVSKKTIQELLSNTSNKVQLRCALWYCRALGESGQLDEAEATLKAVLKVWTARWRTFTVGCKEHLLQVLLSLGFTFEHSGRFDKCLVWSEVAYQIANFCTELSSVPLHTAQACALATKALLGRTLENGAPVLHDQSTYKKWIGRLSVLVSFVRIFGMVFTRLILFSSFRMILNTAISSGLWCELTTAALLVFFSAVKNNPNAHRMDKTVGVSFPLFLTLVLACAVSDKADLNDKFLESVGMFMCNYCRSDTAFHDLILESCSTVCKLTNEHKCWLYGFAVAMARRIWDCSNGLQENPLVVRVKIACTGVASARSPDPAVIREVINRLISECHCHGRGDLVKTLTDEFELWPGTGACFPKSVSC